MWHLWIVWHSLCCWHDRALIYANDVIKRLPKTVLSPILACGSNAVLSLHIMLSSWLSATHSFFNSSLNRNSLFLSELFEMWHINKCTPEEKRLSNNDSAFGQTPIPEYDFEKAFARISSQIVSLALSSTSSSSQAIGVSLSLSLSLQSMIFLGQQRLCVTPIFTVYGFYVYLYHQYGSVALHSLRYFSFCLLSFITLPHEHTHSISFFYIK